MRVEKSVALLTRRGKQGDGNSLEHYSHQLNLKIAISERVVADA